MPKISVELSSFGANYARLELKNYVRQHQRKVDELMRRLEEIGLRDATVRFQHGVHDGNQMPDVRVDRIENGFKIVAEGEDVCFIEFGAGDAAGSHPDKDKVSIETYPGSWSEEHAQQYSENGYWYYNGEQLTEIQAEMPLYCSMREMERNISKIAKEVFGSK